MSLFIILFGNKAFMEGHLFYKSVKGCQGRYTMNFCLWMKDNLPKKEFDQEYAMNAWAVWKVRQDFIHGDCR